MQVFGYWPIGFLATLQLLLAGLAYAPPEHRLSSRLSALTLYRCTAMSRWTWLFQWWNRCERDLEMQVFGYWPIGFLATLQLLLESSNFALGDEQPIANLMVNLQVETPFRHAGIRPLEHCCTRNVHLTCSR